MLQKSYDGKPSLYLIPTPIGNLDDITLRAIKTLKKIEVLFAEDTRETIKLLNHLKIHKKIISNHNYNESKNIDKLLEHLKNGFNVGLVSDRGTPVISDPGYGLVKAAIEHDYNVIALPGPTALIPALIVSGLEPLPFLFYGFLNHKKTSKVKELKNLKHLKVTLIFYESPHRVLSTLKEMLKVFGNRKISLSREISKKFEEVYRGKIESLIPFFDNKIKGELVLVVEKGQEENLYGEMSISEHLKVYLDQGLEGKEAIKQVAQERKVSKKEIYKVYHNIE